MFSWHFRERTSTWRSPLRDQTRGAEMTKQAASSPLLPGGSRIFFWRTGLSWVTRPSLGQITSLLNVPAEWEPPGGRQRCRCCSPGSYRKKQRMKQVIWGCQGGGGSCRGQQRHTGRGFCYNQGTEKEPRKPSGTHVLSELHCVPQKTCRS